MIRTLLAALVVLMLPVFASAEIPEPEASTWTLMAPTQLAGETLQEFDAPEADQGVAVDEAHFYAVDNYVIGKFDKKTGALIKRWIGPKDGLITHLNSCFVEDGLLQCANSNYPETPMASSVEVFRADMLTHIDSHSLGLLDEGSLTWHDHVPGGWIAGFAHYAGKGGLDYKDPSFAGVVLYDEAWRRRGGWQLPAAVLDRMAPYAASGGAIGPDGFLYVMGHDRPEMYVLAKPSMGPKLIHLATIALEAEGQAFSWDHTLFNAERERHVYVISRNEGKVRVIEIPALASPPAYALPFR